MTDIQDITDSLARRIQRPVNIDDTQMQLLTHSAHEGAIDDGRLASILRRRVPERVVEWLNSLGITAASGPTRIPANPELGTLARICVPIRCRDTLLGYLWVIDPDETLTSEEIGVVNIAASAAGNILYHEQLLKQLKRSRERELLRDLLADQPDLRRYAADELVTGDMFVDGSPVFVLVVRPILSSGKTWDDDLQVSVEETLDQARWNRPLRTCLQLVRTDHGVVIATGPDLKRHNDEVLALGHRLHSAMEQRLAETGLGRVIVGIGEGQQSLVDSVKSYLQAQRATRVAEIAPIFGPVAAWWQLGIYQMLSQLPLESLTADALHPGLVVLLEQPGGDGLVETLERYLDNAGDAKATATELALHRATLYYRLQRIEEIANVDLRRGEDRLALHLGLKIARLVHLHPRDERKSTAVQRRPRPGQH